MVRPDLKKSIKEGLTRHKAKKFIMRSIYDNTAIGGAIAIFGSALAVTATGLGVDTKGYNTAAIRLSVSKVTSAITSIGTNQSIAAVLEESADNSTFSAALENNGGQIGCVATASSLAAVLASARIEGLGLSNRLRYLRVKLTTYQGSTGGVPAGAICTGVAVIELGRAYNVPTTTQSSGGPTGTPATTASNT